MWHEAQVLQVEDVAQEDATVPEVLRAREKHCKSNVRMAESLLKYCEYKVSNKVEVEVNLEVVAEPVGKVEHEVEVVVQAHVES